MENNFFVMKKEKSNNTVFSEMENRLKQIKRQSIMESIFFDEDHHDEDFEQHEQSQPAIQQQQTMGIGDTLKQIRILVIEGLKALADNPSSVEYDTLKRILFICDKPMEKKETNTEK